MPELKQRAFSYAVVLLSLALGTAHGIHYGKKIFQAEMCEKTPKVSKVIESTRGEPNGSQD